MKPDRVRARVQEAHNRLLNTLKKFNSQNMSSLYTKHIGITVQTVSKQMCDGRLTEHENHPCYQALYTRTLQVNPFLSADQLLHKLPTECEEIVAKWLRMIN